MSNMLNRKLVRDLYRMRGQVAAIALVVASAVATFLTMRGAYDSLLAARSSYYASFRFSDVFAAATRAPEHVAAKLERIRGVAVVYTRVATDATLDVPGLAEPATAHIVSLPAAGRPRLDDIYIRAGRAIDARSRGEVLISESFAKANGLTPGATLHATIHGKYETLRVVGIALSPEYVNEVPAGEIFPDPRRFAVLWMNREELAAALGMKNAFNDVQVALAKSADAREVIAAIDRILLPYGGVGAHGRSEHVSHMFLEGELAQDRVSATTTPVIFLGVAAFLIQLVLGRLVAAQRDQIAILKAFGFGRGAIASHYLQLALLNVAIGTLLGVPAGFWLGRGLTRLYQNFFHFPALPFAPTTSTVTVSLLISVVAGVGGAFSAVRRASSLAPAVGMRGEPPPAFSRGLLDLLRVTKFITPLARMLVRTLERRPWRTASSVLGIALAIMVIILGRYAFDAVDLMLVLQFEKAQVADATISFSEKRDPRARADVRHLPGVAAVEPFRSLTVRMSHGHRSRLVPLLGLESGGRLRRIVDVRGKETRLPARGLVLTKKLADTLGVRPGEVVHVQVLDGRRREADVVVATLAEELVGMSGYLSRAELNALAGDGDVMSGAYINTDAARHHELASLLKTTPGIRSVAFRQITLRSARESIRKNMALSSWTLIAFACVIAIGIVYNGSRVSLAERSRELASLRVLGFSVPEVTTIITGEQILLTALAIPLGLMLGRIGCRLIALGFDSELYRIPVTVSARSYAIAVSVVIAAAFISAVTARRRVAKLDLVEVLKTRE